MFSSTTTQLFSIRSANHTIGWSDLARRDRAMGVARGMFRPGSAYARVRPVFRIFANALSETTTRSNESEVARYYAARDALSLSLHRPDGTQIPTSFIHIVDLVESSPEDLEIEIAVLEPSAWELIDL